MLETLRHDVLYVAVMGRGITEHAEEMKERDLSEEF